MIELVKRKGDIVILRNGKPVKIKDTLMARFSILRFTGVHVVTTIGEGNIIESRGTILLVCGDGSIIPLED